MRAEFRAESTVRQSSHSPVAFPYRHRKPSLLREIAHRWRCRRGSAPTHFGCRNNVCEPTGLGLLRLKTSESVPQRTCFPAEQCRERYCRQRSLFVPEHWVSMPEPPGRRQKEAELG